MRHAASFRLILTLASLGGCVAGCASIFGVDFDTAPAIADAGNDSSCAPDQRDCQAAPQLDPDPFPRVRIGSGFVCALKQDGSVWCWGDGFYGATGFGDSNAQLTPRQVPGLTHAATLSTGAAHSCAVLADGTAQCWGYNEFGQIGLGLSGDPVRSPQKVVGLGGISQIAAGSTHSCALIGNSGEVYCWGANDRAQLGTGKTTPKELSPQRVQNLSGAREIHARGPISCAVRNDATVRCWGSNVVGELGLAAATPLYATSAVEPQGLGQVLQLALGNQGICALKPDQRVWCWGNNVRAQVGQGFTSAAPIYKPSEVLGLRATGIAALGSGFCAHSIDDHVLCWGSNRLGLLAVADSGDPVLRPSTVRELYGNSAVIAGEDNACAHGRDGKLRCWGKNDFGQIGNQLKNPDPVTSPYALDPF